MAERKNIADMKVKKKVGTADGKEAPKKTTAAAGKAAPKKESASATPKKPGNAASKKNASNNKPWEKMYANKAANGKTGANGKGKIATKSDASAPKKPVKEFRDFLYLLPKKTTAKNLEKTLDFLDRKAIEVWEDECVLEITTKDGVITFEDIRDSLEKEDEKTLNDLRVKQVISCDYESTDAETVRKVMDAFLKAFGGKIGSDTEDFTPFLTVDKL
jgi:hypothetical protein